MLCISDFYFETIMNTMHDPTTAAFSKKDRMETCALLLYFRITISCTMAVE